MPDIRALVKKLIADGESEDVIKAVIKKMDAAEDGSDIKSGLPDMSPAPPPKDEYKGPDTWMGGFKKSLFQKAPGSQFSEAMQAGGEGFIGNLESIKDIPANLAYGAKDLLDFHLNPGQTSLRMFNDLKQIPDIVKNAGADPRTFGRMVGQFTTAPIVTEGLGAAALRGPGAINRIPRVNKTLSSIGKTLDGTRHSNYVPTTSRGLVAGAVRGVARPVGRVLSRAGERGRLAGSKVESANEAAARTTPNKPPSDDRNVEYAGGGEGATRNRPVRHDTPDLSRNSEFTRPISGDAPFVKNITPYPRPGDRPPGIPPERSPIPTPDPIPVGEGGLSSRYRYDPFEMGQDPIGELSQTLARPKTAPVEPLPPPFNPGNRTPPDLTQPVAPPNVDSPFGQVDPTTGEIIPPLRGKKLQGKWNRPGKSEPDVAPEDFEFGPDEPGVDVDPTGTDVINDAGRQFADEIESQRFPGDEAFDLGEMNPGFRQTSNMPDWGQQASIPRPVNPLRPEVPPGQVTNRQMFENSERRALENRIADQDIRGRKFAEEVSPGHEFDPDMMFTPDEFGQADIPPMRSPVENQFDPRTSNLAPEPDIPPMRTIAPEEWGDWGPDADIPTLVPDANGSHVAAPREGPAEFAGKRQTPDIANDSNVDLDAAYQKDPESVIGTRVNSVSQGNNIHGIIVKVKKSQGMEWGLVQTPNKKVGYAPENAGWHPLSDLSPTNAEPSGWMPFEYRNRRGVSPNEGPAEFSGRRQGPDTADDSPSTYPTNDINSPEGRRARYDYNANRVSPENRSFIDHLPDDALADFIDRQSQNPNYMNHDVGRDLVYHASDTQAMRASGDLIYESPEQARAFREAPRRQIVDWNNRGTNNPGSGHTPERDVRFDTGSQAYFDRNTGVDVTMPTDAEIVRARGINDGSISDPTPVLSSRNDYPPLGYGPTQPPKPYKTPKGQTLDEFEKPRTGKGRERLTSLFGEERAGKLASGEREFATTSDSNVETNRPGGRKKIDDSTRQSWNSFERNEIATIDHDVTKPGLTVSTEVSSSWAPNKIEMHYRDPKGKPVGILRTDNLGKGITAFAVDSSLGLGRGKIVFKMLNEAFDRGITEASGSTSDLTRNLIERVKRLIDDSHSRGTADDVFGSSELELEINKILDGADSPEFSSTPDESMGFAGSEDIFSTANDGPRLVGGKTQPATSRSKTKTDLVDHRVTDPNGKHLGDIVMTEERIRTLQKHPAFKDMTREQVIEQLHEAQLQTMLDKAGIPENARTRVKTEPIDHSTNKTVPQETPAFEPDPTSHVDSGMYKVQSEEGVEFPNDTLAGPDKMVQTSSRFKEEPSDYGEFGAESIDFSGTSTAPAFPGSKPKTSAFKTSTKVALDPDKDFGPGGDIKPILQEVRRLNSDNAADSRYRKLLPEIMRNELGPGETWKGKLDRLIDQLAEELGPEEGAYRLADNEKINDFTRGYTRDGAELHSKHNIPLLTQKEMSKSKFSKGKLNKESNKPWISPKFVQQHPGLAKKLKAQYDKNKK